MTLHKTQWGVRVYLERSTWLEALGTFPRRPLVPKEVGNAHIIGGMGKHFSHVCQLVAGIILWVWGGLAFRDSGGIGSFDSLGTVSTVMFLSGVVLAGNGPLRLIWNRV